ncbi:hypothetical protein [Oryza sativa Japonica Group]|uniref:Uncharacterized protein n=1 Tax=Oryza sativa subsp. japonica TaxID=39947 RepID=Q5NBC8_ORYSJ|nr:hypothetical protein [Oryza sativa Japonica Group]BAD81228.1 hypothetical protein [Oryza sativa Japonica Group]
MMFLSDAHPGRVVSSKGEKEIAGTATQRAQLRLAMVVAVVVWLRGLAAARRHRSTRRRRGNSIQLTPPVSSSKPSLSFGSSSSSRILVSHLQARSKQPVIQPVAALSAAHRGAWIQRLFAPPDACMSLAAGAGELRVQRHTEREEEEE